MTSKLNYKIITTIGEENSKNNNAFEKLENMVSVYLNEGWRPVGGISVSSVLGPKTAGSTKDTWFTRATQAIVLETDE
jgi:hypothetical protein